MGARARRRELAARMTNDAGLIDYRPQLAESPDPGSRILRTIALLVILVLTFLLGFASGHAYAGEPCIESMTFEATSDDAKAHSFGEHLVMQPHQAYTYTVRVRVNPHEDHRLIALSWDGEGAGAGSSIRALDGDSAISQRFRFRDQPGSHWVYVAAVYDANGKLVGRRTLETLFMEEQ
jgi:hypothetical protein